MKKTLLTIAMVLVLGLVANAKTLSDGYAWEDTEEYYDPTSSLFDWNSFVGLFDWMSSSQGAVRLTDPSVDFFIPGEHGLMDDIAVPLGSGFVVLVGLGAAYLAGKKRKED